MASNENCESDIENTASIQETELEYGVRKKIISFILSIPSKIVIFFIMFYRMGISPHFPACCRFTPTCSEYALIAFKKYNIAKATILTLKRLIRCRPGGGSGYDPVP